MSAPSSIQIPTLLSQLGVAQGRWYRPAAPKKNVAVMTSPGELPFEDISAHRAPTLTTLHGAWWSPCIGRGDLGSWLWLLPWRPGPARVGRAAEAQRKTREGQVDSPRPASEAPSNLPALSLRLHLRASLHSGFSCPRCHGHSCRRRVLQAGPIPAHLHGGPDPSALGPDAATVTGGAPRAPASHLRASPTSPTLARAPFVTGTLVPPLPLFK